ncbi:L-type lectin-domain containing protein [Enterococcus sp. AZ109]|uniref:L-type lectin-domain containing protein n=1 Tax=Enterococcus sp. AZ109 TaxID=2774634 RepID=UPI003F23AA37
MSKKCKGLGKTLAFCFASSFILFSNSDRVQADSNLDYFLQEEAKEFIPITGNFDYGADASLGGDNVVKVTEDKQSQKGIVWANNQLDMTQNWSTEMKMFLGYDEWQGNRSADGMAFVLHNDPRGKNAVGDAGERLAVWGVNDSDNYIRNGWAVEFDLYANTTMGGHTFDADIYGSSSMHNYGHIANSYTKVGGHWIEPPGKFAMTHEDLMMPASATERLNNGRSKTFKASWNAETKKITYNISYIDATGKTIDYGTVTKQLDMNQFGSDKLYWGFTGSTGEQKAAQYVGFKEFPQTINAEAIPQETILGEALEVNEANLSDYLTITSGDNVQIASIKNDVDYHLIGTQNILVELMDKHGNTETVEVPVTVKWGNSVVYGSFDYDFNGRTSAAFTLNTLTSPYITASKGKIDDNEMMHSLLQNQLYYTFNWFDLSNKQNMLMTETLDGDRFIKATGDDLKTDKLKEWGNDQRQLVNYGDIVRAWQTETDKNWLHEDEIRHSYNAGKKAVYYEIHPNGYRLLHFNHLAGKKGTVPLFSSEEYLDRHVSEFIDLKGYPNIKAKKFSQYPDTQTIGEKSAKVLVEETLLSTGKTVEYEYDVLVNVEDTREVTAVAVPQQAILGTDLSTFNYKKFVKDIKFGEETLKTDQYDVELINKLFTDFVGDQTAMVRVSLTSDREKSVEVPVLLNVKWGNSVVYGSYDYGGDGRTTAAFTLHPGKKPFITATQGKNDDNHDMHANFHDKQYYSFNWFDFSDKAQFLMTEKKKGNASIYAQGEDLKKDTLKKWGTKQKQPVNNGDVVRAWQVETNKNWLYVDEAEQTHNQGKEAVYYEVTENGYRLLHFNHLVGKSGTVSLYTTEKDLDEKVEEYMDLKGYPNIEVKKFTQYPNTKVVGAQKAVVLIEETLATTGKKVQYEYEVTVNVEPGELTLNAPETINFGKISRSKREQIVQRQVENNLGLSVNDSRGDGNQGNWRLTAQAKDTDDTLAPYLIVKNNPSEAGKYLNQEPVEIHTQAKQIDVDGPLEVDISEKWTKETGILLKVPSKNDLENKEHTTKITWNLLEGPQ